MRNEFDIQEDQFNEQQIDFLRKAVSLMKVFTIKAMDTSKRFVQACGRKEITGTDMYYALIYEAHEFLKQDMDLNENEYEDSYLTDSDDENSEEDGIHSEEEQYSLELKVNDEKEFHAKVLEYANSWRDWFPEDPVQEMMKRYIDEKYENVQ